MKLRTLGACALLSILVGVVFFAPVWALPIAVSVMSVIGVHELLCATGFLNKNKRLIAYAMVFSALVPVWVFFGAGERGATAGILLYSMLIFIEGIIGSEEATLDRICVSFFAAVAIPFFFSSIIRLAEMGGGNLAKGRLLIVFPVLGAFASDVFAFFIGRKFGKTKLAPKISPNKTVEGAVAGFLFSPIAIVIYAIILDNCTVYSVNYINAVAVGFAASFAGIIGDLSMSLVKRRSGIKDFGKIIPGHGGVLDRFDSVLFAAPFAEIVMIILPVIVA